MSFFRTRFSTLVVWGMIPLALGAGMPSTGCVCANGHIKLFCGHVLGSSAKSHSLSHSPTGEVAGRQSSCCGDAAADDADEASDCCGGGFCCHGARSEQPGIGSKTCCKPILTVPSVAPEIVGVPCDGAWALVTVAEEIGALVHPSFAPEAAEFDTGPPLDRVILFRSLLI